jgi:hypothetical protein
MSKSNSATWIDDGEKYALVGLNVKVEGTIPTGNVTLTSARRARRSLGRNGGL